MTERERGGATGWRWVLKKIKKIKSTPAIGNSATMVQCTTLMAGHDRLPGLASLFH